MIKQYKLLNGEIMTFSNGEEFRAIITKEFELREEQREQEKKRVDLLINKIELYVVQELQAQYKNYNIGLVNTRIREDIKKYNSFCIWIDKGGQYISHKIININDTTINQEQEKKAH